MPQNFFHKGISLFLRQQTNILSAAFIIMTTVILSFILAILRERLLASIFGPTNTLGIYFYSTLLPDTGFQLLIASALSTAFIPVFSGLLSQHKEKEAHAIASKLLILGLSVYAVFSILLFVGAPLFLTLFNIKSNFSNEEMILMGNLMRIALVSQFFFIFGSFLSALLQSYNHFFIPGLAAAFYNLGIIIAVFFLSPHFGIYSAPIGMVLGSLFFVFVQFPLSYKVGFRVSFLKSSLISDGVRKILHLMWPRTLSLIIFQLGTLAIASLISYLSDPGRMNVIYNFAKTLAYAPIVLIGQSIAQAAFPILSRQKEQIEDFKRTFITSFYQMLYLILPISALILVLRIPIVRLVWGAQAFDWNATVLTGRTLAFLSISIAAQALMVLVLRGYYALHNTFVPLVVGGVSTGIMIGISFFAVVHLRLGIESVAIAYSIASILDLLVLLVIFDRMVGGFDKLSFLFSMTKFFFATIFTGVALYIPIKLLDQLVFDTTRTINLIFLTGISTFCGLSIYLFLTWLFNVKEATTFLLLFKRLGDWRQILGKSEETIDGTRFNP